MCSLTTQPPPFAVRHPGTNGLPREHQTHARSCCLKTGATSVRYIVQYITSIPVQGSVSRVPLSSPSAIHTHTIHHTPYTIHDPYILLPYPALLCHAAGLASYRILSPRSLHSSLPILIPDCSPHRTVCPAVYTARYMPSLPYTYYTVNPSHSHCSYAVSFPTPPPPPPYLIPITYLT